MRFTGFFLLACVVLAAPAEADPPSRDWIDVRSHGAIGNGRADDSPAFEAALAAVPAEGGTIWIGGGSYRLTRTLYVDRGDLAVICGPGARLIVAGSGVRILYFRGHHSPHDRISGIRVEGCSFEDPDPAAHVAVEESHGVVLRNVDGAVLRNLSFIDIGDESVDVIRSTRVTIADCRFRGGSAAITKPWNGSLGITNSSLVEVRGNVIEDNRNGNGIRVTANEHVDGVDSEHIVIADNLILRPHDESRLGASSGSGIAIRPVSGEIRGLIVTGNQIVEPYRMGIDIRPAGGGQISGVVVANNVVQGGGAGMNDVPGRVGAIGVVGTLGGAVTGNVVLDWNGGARHAALHVGNDGFSVTGNALGGNFPEAIRMGKGEQGNVVVGNLAPDGRGVRATAHDLVGLNKSDASDSVRLPSIESCAAIATDGEGRVMCAEAPQ